MTDNIFEAASREKLEFETRAGVLKTEDLWGLSVEPNGRKLSLEEIAVDLNAQLHEKQQTFFAAKTSTRETYLIKLKLDIVKHIGDTLLAEQKAALDRRNAREQLQQLQSALAEKQRDAIKGMEIEDLQKKITELEAAAGN